METIIYIAAVICGAQSWNEIAEFGKAKFALFEIFNKVKPPISYYGGKQTMLKRILSLIPPHKLNSSNKCVAFPHALY